MKSLSLDEVDVNGLKFWVRNSRDEAVLKAGIDTNVYDFPQDLQGKVVVDIGAFIGGISIMCASRGATVYAAEPSKENFRIFTKNIKHNNLQDSVIPWRVALGQHRRKTRNIDINTENPASNVLQGLENTVRDLDHTERVPTRTLKEFFQDNNLSGCDILKLDCEGAEVELLDDIVELQVPSIVMELHSRAAENLFTEKLPMYDKESLGHSETRFTLKASNY